MCVYMCSTSLSACPSVLYIKWKTNNRRTRVMYRYRYDKKYILYRLFLGNGDTQMSIHGMTVVVYYDLYNVVR